MSTPTLQFRLAGADRFAIVDDETDHVMLLVDADMAPRAALKAEIESIRAKANAQLKRAALLEAALENHSTDFAH